MTASQITHPEATLSDKDKAEFYKAEFLDFVKGELITSEALVKAWNIWSLYESAHFKSVGMVNTTEFHMNRLLEV